MLYSHHIHQGYSPRNGTPAFESNPWIIATDRQNIVLLPTLHIW